MNNFLNNNNNFNDFDNSLILTKNILSLISFFACFLFIILYLYLLIQVKICKSENNSHKNIGLGSNYMLMLIISNLLGTIPEIILFYSLTNKTMNDGKCALIGFFRNYFELCCVSWISMITYLFYSSTLPYQNNINTEMKQIIFGIVYAFIIPLIFVLIPYFNNNFEYDETSKCSFQKKICFSGVLFVIIVLINGSLQLIALFFAYKFYKEKLNLLKEQNEEEYKLLRIYVWIFFLFPFYLVISRIIKLLARLNNFFLFCAEISFALSGFFDSFICFFFIKGALPCFKNNNDYQSLENSVKSDMND